MGRLYFSGGAGGIVITAGEGIGVKQQTNNWRGLSRIWVIDELMGVGRIERLGETVRVVTGKTGKREGRWRCSGDRRRIRHGTVEDERRRRRRRKGEKGEKGEKGIEIKREQKINWPRCTVL